jgi:hypothetical protein
VYQSLGEDDATAGEEAEAEVGRRVLGDLLEKTRRESKKVVVHARSNNRKSVVHISEEEERLAFGVGDCDVGRVKGRRVVVENTEEIIVIPD